MAAYQNVLAPTDLFISEYVEGSSNNKALEFYNGTGSAIDLAAGGYSVEMYFNGNTPAGLTINLSGTVAHGSTFVLAHNMANLGILPNQTNGNGWFNGNDAIVLQKNGIILDAIGQIGFDPGTAWTGGGVSTLDRTLRRKTTITTGDSNPNNTFNPSLEWSGFPVDTFSGLGSHNQAPEITVPSGNLNYTENDGFAILDTNATATDPDLTNFNGGTLTINFTSGATTDDILMIRNQGSSAGQIAAGIDSPGLNLIAYSGIPFASFTGGTQGNPLTINFTTNFATDTAVSALMRNIIYGNISDNSLPGDRTVQFQLTDALGLASSPASKTIAFTPENDAPIIAVPDASFTLYDGTNTPNNQDFEYRTLP
ncbi:lamin tail domain-containing protein, partial [Phormidium pseudopriestleyi FRX01]|nr:lamin tail domain-containing protein [Phormidium pseudopriestleyi FRX01]